MLTVLRYLRTSQHENKTMQNKLLDETFESAKTRYPKLAKAVYPRRIQPPNGYANPRFFATDMLSGVFVGFSSDMKMFVHAATNMAALMVVKYGVPTYFVRSEFAQAASHTKPPADFKFSEMKWPLPAMVFALPLDFSVRTFGYCVPFIYLCQLPHGDYPACIKGLPEFELPISASMPVHNEGDKFCIGYSVYVQNKLPLSYISTYLPNHTISTVRDCEIDDATYYEESLIKSRLPQDMQDSMFSDKANFPKEGEEEKAFMDKVQSFALKLMLTLTARPDVIVTGGLARAEKVKKGRTVDALWNPNLIGWHYRAARPAAVAASHGSHASPRMHWRLGHIRNQPYGPKPWDEKTPTRALWIEPVLINAE